MLSTQFENIIDKHDYSGDELNSKWGAHDEHVFSKQLNSLKDEQKPFFSVILTLSTHEPFKVPMKTPFNGSEVHERFKSSAYYTDYCIGNYMKEAKQQEWYDNTLFVFVADHGHRYPKLRDVNFPEARRVTALITGGALVDSLRGKVFDKICNHHDLTSTLSNQLGLSTEPYKWSNDVFNASKKEYAYFTNENVLGWVTPGQKTMYWFATQSHDIFMDEGYTEQDTTEIYNSKAYLQTLYQDYLNH